MSASLEAAWQDVIAKTGPDAIDALVVVLDRTRKLDALKDALIREFVAEHAATRPHQRADRHGTAERWLHQQLADGEKR